MMHGSLYDPSDEEIDALCQRADVGRLVTVADDGTPCVGLYPFLVRRPDDRSVFTASNGASVNAITIEIHLNARDEQVAHLRTHPRCAFEVDETLSSIPSYWVDPENAVYATAYHRTVQFACDAVLSDRLEDVVEQQNRLMAKHQPEGGYRALRVEDPMYDAMVGLLVAITLEVRDRKAKFKLAQNRTPEVRRTIVANLRERNRLHDAVAADAIEATIPR
jgi:transcriptional regulator